MKVVVTDYNYPNLEVEEKVFSQSGIKVEGHHCTREEEVIKVSRDADGLLNQYAPVSKKVIDSLKRCKVIGRYGIGVDTINVDAATKKGIVVVNVPSYCEDEVSDHALALILSAVRKVNLYDRAIKKGSWDWKMGKPIRRLRGQCLGLVGCGKIGRKLAKKAMALGLEVIAFDPYLASKELKKEGIEKVDFDQLLTESDIISLHLPLTEETHHLISTAELEKMKPTALLVNVARGAVIDEKALHNALVDDQIAGACLDVIEDEPSQGKVSKKTLFGLKNIYLTPHAAWYSEEALIELRTKAAKDVARVLSRKIPSGFVNSELRGNLDLKPED